MNSRLLTRILFLICLTVPAASAQARFHFGVDVGIPFTDTLSSTSSLTVNPSNSSLDRYNSVTKRLLIGPAFRLELEHGLGIEFDALYQRVNFDRAMVTSTPSFASRSFEQTTANRWQFPLLIQYRWTMSRTPMSKARPFVEAGPSISRIANSRSTITSTTSSLASNSLAPNLPPVRNSSSSSRVSGPGGTWAGVTMGGGMDFPFFRGHLRPEFRFSHWFLPNTGSVTGQPFGAVFIGVGDILPSLSASSPVSRANQNEAVFLLGLTF